jgi:hypothetical protein
LKALALLLLAVALAPSVTSQQVADPDSKPPAPHSISSQPYSVIDAEPLAAGIMTASADLPPATPLEHGESIFPAPLPFNPSQPKRLKRPDKIDVQKKLIGLLVLPADDFRQF